MSGIDNPTFYVDPQTAINTADIATNTDLLSVNALSKVSGGEYSNFSFPPLVDEKIYNVIFDDVEDDYSVNTTLQVLLNTYDIVYANSTGVTDYVDKFPANLQSIKTGQIFKLQYNGTNSYFKILNPLAIIHYNPTTNVRLNIGDTVIVETTDRYPNTQVKLPTGICTSYDVVFESLSNESNTSSIAYFNPNNTTYSGQFSRNRRYTQLSGNSGNEGSNSSESAFRLAHGYRIAKQNLHFFVDNQNRVGSSVVGRAFMSDKEGLGYADSSFSAWWDSQGAANWTKLGNFVLDKSRTSRIKTVRVS